MNRFGMDSTLFLDKKLNRVLFHLEESLTDLVLDSSRYIYPISERLIVPFHAFLPVGKRYFGWVYCKDSGVDWVLLIMTSCGWGIDVRYITNLMKDSFFPISMGEFPWITNMGNFMIMTLHGRFFKWEEFSVVVAYPLKIFGKWEE